MISCTMGFEKNYADQDSPELLERAEDLYAERRINPASKRYAG